MKNGYYLAAYLHIDEIAHLYEFRIRHDQNVSLWKKQDNCLTLVHYWELERITGIKRHGLSLFNRKQAEDLLNTLLSRYDLCLENMEAIIGTPLLDTIDDYHSNADFPTQSYHSIAHMFSALMVDTQIFYNNTILGFAVDGGPDTVMDKNVNKKNYYTGCLSLSGKIEVFEVISPGFIWTYARKKFNLREGTLMALATASTSELIVNNMESIIEVRRLNDLQTANKYVSDLWGRIENINEYDKGILFNGFDERFTEYDNKVSMFSKEIQKMSLRIMDYNIQNAINSHGIIPEDCYIALAGGYILNCPTNSYIMEKYNFKGFLAPPCVNDAGISLGIALYYFNKNMNKVNFKLKSAFYGDAFDNLDSIISSVPFQHFIESSSNLDNEQFTTDLEKAPLIWFYNNAEIGPRALGHRSILADPRTSVSKDKLNEIKQRQWWRPVAPIVLADKMEEWFEKIYQSPFMLHVINVKDCKIKEIPAICHLDATARLQTINQDTDPVLYSVINGFYERTKIPIICNTSLNDIGEPIINTIEECLNFALRKRFKIIYINGKRIVLKNHQNYPLSTPLRRPINLNPFTEDEKKKLKKIYNPFNLSKEVMIFKYLRPDIGQNVDITDYTAAEKLKKYAWIGKQMLSNIPIPGL
ncbi:MAG: hypothetical protein FWE14_11395 [Lachnospiraceae bacterium]|nr:hypothetical protein [Lachnospiraceae bacterium]